MKNITKTFVAELTQSLEARGYKKCSLLEFLGRPTRDEGFIAEYSKQTACGVFSLNLNPPIDRGARLFSFQWSFRHNEYGAFVEDLWGPYLTEIGAYMNAGGLSVFDRRIDPDYATSSKIGIEPALRQFLFQHDTYILPKIDAIFSDFGLMEQNLLASAEPELKAQLLAKGLRFRFSAGMRGEVALAILRCYLGKELDLVIDFAERERARIGMPMDEDHWLRCRGTLTSQQAFLFMLNSLLQCASARKIELSS